MWPRSVSREYAVPRSRTELITAWRSQIGLSVPMQRITGRVFDEGFDLTLSLRHSFPVRCRGQFTETPEGVVVRVSFSLGVSCSWVVVAALACGGAAFVGLCVWDSTLIGPWAVLCGIGVAVALAWVTFLSRLSLVFTRRMFERRLVYGLSDTGPGAEANRVE